MITFYLLINHFSCYFKFSLCSVQDHMHHSCIQKL